MPVVAGNPTGRQLVPNGTRSAKIGTGRINTRADGNPTDSERRASGGLFFMRIRIKVTAPATNLEARFVPGNTSTRFASKFDQRSLRNTFKGNNMRIGIP